MTLSDLTFNWIRLWKIHGSLNWEFRKDESHDGSKIIRVGKIIEFKSNGQVWQYFDIPEYLWYEMESASSVGKFFHSNIRGAFAENRIG